MFSTRFLSGVLRSKSILNKYQTPNRVQKFEHHDAGPPQPFDNMPFTITNRYVATLFWSIFFGTGLWAPYVIVWYSMAKKSL